MIQDIQPRKFSNTYAQKQPENGSLLAAFHENSIFLKQGEEAGFTAFGELAAWCKGTKTALPRLVFLFSIDTRDYYLTELPEAFIHEKEKEGYAFVRMFEVRGRKPKYQVFAASVAWHLYVWYRDNRFCGRCGRELIHSGKLRMMECPCCGNQVYPKIAPAVIVGVTHHDKILMTTYAGREYKRYALIAGFTEIGETAEETVRREVFEEVGLHVRNIRYYKSQPWDFDQNLLLGYFCDLEAEGEEICLDEEELATAEWIDYRDIPEDKEDLSLTKEMMLHFKNCKREKGN